MERSAASGADSNRAARLTRSCQSCPITVSPRWAKTFCSRRRETPSRCAIFAGGEIGIVEPQRNETSGASVEVGTSRRAQTACFRHLGAVPLRSDRQRNEIVNMIDGEPARLGRRGSTVAEQKIGVSGQQPDGLGVDRDCRQHGTLEIADRKVAAEERIVGQARRRSLRHHSIMARRQERSAARDHDLPSALHS